MDWGLETFLNVESVFVQVLMQIQHGSGHFQVATEPAKPEVADVTIDTQRPRDIKVNVVQFKCCVISAFQHFPLYPVLSN